jgi:hypothetical protein
MQQSLENSLLFQKVFKKSMKSAKQKKRRYGAFFVCYPFLNDPKMARTNPPKNLGSLMV